MGAKVWDINAHVPVAGPASPEESKPQARWSGLRAAHRQFVMMGEELRACSETLTLATSQLLSWRKVSSLLISIKCTTGCLQAYQHYPDTHWSASFQENSIFAHCDCFHMILQPAADFSKLVLPPYDILPSPGCFGVSCEAPHHKPRAGQWSGLLTVNVQTDQWVEDRGSSFGDSDSDSASSHDSAFLQISQVMSMLLFLGLYFEYPGMCMFRQGSRQGDSSLTSKELASLLFVKLEY